MSRVIIKGHKYYLMTDNNQRFYYDEGRKIGSGAMGTVYLGFNFDTQEKVAIKRVKDKYSNIPTSGKGREWKPRLCLVIKT